MMTLRKLSCLPLLIATASCSSFDPPITPLRPPTNMMTAPNSPLVGSTLTPMAQNAAGQRARYQAEAAGYRRQANQATGDERERLLQMAERLDRQSAALNPQ